LSAADEKKVSMIQPHTGFTWYTVFHCSYSMLLCSQHSKKKDTGVKVGEVSVADEKVVNGLQSHFDFGYSFEQCVNSCVDSLTCTVSNIELTVESSDECETCCMP
jgi:hypothetical protein